MAGKETNIVQEVRLALSQAGATVFRNNVGKLQDKNGRWVTYGLCVGSSDLIGVSPEGVFMAIEVKVPGKHPTQEQIRFIEMVKSKGGIAGVVTSAAEAIELLKGR